MLSQKNSMIVEPLAKQFCNLANKLRNEEFEEIVDSIKKQCILQIQFDYNIMSTYILLQRELSAEECLKLDNVHNIRVSKCDSCVITNKSSATTNYIYYEINWSYDKINKSSNLSPSLSQNNGVMSDVSDEKVESLKSPNDVPMIDFLGTQRWYRNGQLHRDHDLPAVIKANGTKEWYQHDQRHRDNDLPALIWANSSQQWYQNGQLHRNNDMPAIIWSNGTQQWYQNDKLHRNNDLPAVIWFDGTQCWYQNGHQYTPSTKL